MQLGPVQKRWIQSLKDHPERQLKGTLGRKEENSYRACCLGELHLCYLQEKCISKPTWSSLGELFDKEKEHTAVLATSYKLYGLRDDRGSFSEPVRIPKILGKEWINLAQMNDRGLTWKEIAEFVENNPEKVFIKSV